MKNNSISRTLLYTTLGILALSHTAFAQPAEETDSELPPLQHQGNINFVTGGIGDDERTFLESVRKNYNLHILNSGHDGAFVSDAKVSILDKKGEEVLTSDAGPIFYAQLPKGKYTIVENNGTVEQKKTVTVPDRKADVSFIWNE